MNSITPLNPIQQLIFQTLQNSVKPQSAYQLLDAIKTTIPNIKPMMVYRALSFLEDKGLIHKIKSTSTYHSCKDHQHQGSALFLICQKCGFVKELDLQASVLKGLHQMAATAGFSFTNAPGEISGLCNQCH